MRVLVACEFSGIVRDAFRARGHDAYSCDYLSSERPGPHYCGNVRGVLMAGWDLMIAHPPCTYLSVSGAAHFNKPGRRELQQEAIEFCEFLWNQPIEKIVLENPIGVLSTRSSLGKPTQIIQPWQFGEDASKKTCLWLKGLTPLQPTKVILKDQYANQTPSGQNKLGPSKDRAKIRSRTYQGIADAMAEQWG